jgi:hypothetical protein
MPVFPGSSGRYDRRTFNPMSDANPQQPMKKSAVRTSEQIAHFLEQTGFVFEMRMNEVLLKAGYFTEINEEFLDLEQDTLREIDIAASKVVNDINIHFVIECKQSVTDKWIFICNKRVPRLMYAVKHLPRVAIEVMHEKKPFVHFHIFDRRTPVAHNYLCYTIVGDKKADNRQIDECVYKLPKALLYVAAEEEEGRHLFFPLALFSGQEFCVSYDGKLVVEETRFVQYFALFNAETYREQPKLPVPVADLMGPLIFDVRKWEKQDQEKKIRHVTNEFGTAYPIDFVTAAGLSDYLAVIEKQVAAVRREDWPLPEKSKTSG